MFSKDAVFHCSSHYSLCYNIIREGGLWMRLTKYLSKCHHFLKGVYFWKEDYGIYISLPSASFLLLSFLKIKKKRRTWQATKDFVNVKEVHAGIKTRLQLYHKSFTPPWFLCHFATIKKHTFACSHWLNEWNKVLSTAHSIAFHTQENPCDMFSSNKSPQHNLHFNMPDHICYAQ